MARLDRERMMRGIFPHACEVPTRFGDMDVLGHINNVATAELIQEGRVRFAHACGSAKLMTDFSSVVASLHIEYAKDMFYGAPVTVRNAIVDIGRTSYRIAQMAGQNGEVGAFAETVLVLKGKTGTLEIPDAFREILERNRLSF